ncbi:Gram-positive signal peptide protein, YSIRK family [Lactobacillus iners UPII 143-D]|uniref:YSIRK-type signal peptide-containing protein n=1 Tax=Lactobacillus iners TaxID=147802 RepID=UPI0001FD7E59|nr:YSIRK-type signal peptide-containing protein [Lactobacillus iners]EGC79661.1 Gram-positive signal peptide protein, YSIRK family [Lactobacillus iners UPII 143-D]
MVFNRRQSNPCYGIRKLAIGVVSMVISVAFLTGISVAQAKENTSNYQEHLVDKKVSAADLTKTSEKLKNQVEPFRPLNQQDMIKLAKGQLTLPGGRVDPSFYHKSVLEVAGDDDHDGLKNGQELYVEKVNNREFLGYHTHPLLSDSDGDGLLDADEIKNHTNPLVWNICDRDLAMMMELSYRDDNYIKQVLDSHHPLKEKYNGRQEYELMHTELAPFWKAEKSFHESDGFDATFFVTHSDLPYLKDNQVQVLAIRGTKGGADLDDDLNLTLGMTPGQVDSLNKILKQLQDEGALTNTYLTGHSLGGYLAMTALVEARDKGYTGIKKAVTFNAPKIRGNLFNKKMQRVAKEANLLTQRGEAIHYAVSNDNVISAVGNFIGAKSVGNSANGHGSRTYFEDRIMQFGFKQSRRKSSMAGTGDQEANLKKVLSGFSNPVVVTQADAYPAKIQNHIVTEVGVIPDLEKCILNRTELPLAKVEDKTSSMHLYQPYQVGKGQCGSLSLTYQDGSKKTYFVTIDVQEVKPTGVVTSKGDPLVQKAKPAGIITSKVDPLVQEAKPAGVVTSKDDPLVQKANPAGVVISKGEPLLQKANPAGVVISKGEPLVQETNPAGVVTSKVDPLVQKAKPAGVVTSKVDPLVQKAKPAAVITSKVDPLVQKATPAGVVTSKGDPLVELTKADHATELSHLTELLEKKYHLSSRNNLVNRYHQMYILMLKNCLNWEQIVEF